MNTSRAEVTSISRRGVEIRVDGESNFLSFETFPWFVDAPVSEVFEVEMAGPGHLHWPALDIDIDVESIDHPERFPLTSGRGRKGPARGSKRD